MEKRLVYRLSSLGDVILALSVLDLPYEGETHWVVASEFASLLRSHPRIHKVIAFDRRSSGSQSWAQLQRELARVGYSEIWDLHRTHRTRIARMIFALSGSRAPWRVISKERTKRLGYMTFKGLWPRALRPRGLRGEIERLSRTNLPEPGQDPSSQRDSGRPSIGIAASSAWPGKEWPTQSFLEVISANRATMDFVLLGTVSDLAANRLAERLRSDGIPHQNWIGKFSLAELPAQLQKLRAVVSNDSGLAHLSEFAGVPVIGIYGPTRSDLGFGLKLSESIPVDTPLWCSPCSKDGRYCFRVFDRYRCLREISPASVSRSLRRLIGAEKVSREAQA